jgi:tetratricopeptide (TPR) repeat protein
LGLYSRAKENFERFILHNPESVTELFQLGMVERDLGNHDEGLVQWRVVLGLDPHHIEALFYMSETLIWRNSVDEARNLLYKLLETAPNSSRYIPMANELLNRVNTN